MRQEKIIAIAFVVASMIFSAVTYSFGQEVVETKKVACERVIYRGAPCGAVVVRPMMMRGCCPGYVVPVSRYYMKCPCYKRCAYVMRNPCATPCPYFKKCRYVKPNPCAQRVVKCPKSAPTSVQNTSYGLRYWCP